MARWKLLVIIMVFINLIGCSNKDENEMYSEGIETLLDEFNAFLEDSRTLSNECDALKDCEDDVVYSDNDVICSDNSITYSENMESYNDIIEMNKIDIIEEASQIKIKNVLKDETFWGMETDETGNTYIIHADIHGNIINRLSDESIPGEMIYGINDNCILFWNEGYSIYDLNKNEYVIEDFIEGYDEIFDVVEVEDSVVFIVKRSIDSFEEGYEELGLVDVNGNIMYEMSLDKNTLLSEYGIEKEDSNYEIELKWVGKNVFYMPYIGKYESPLDSLIIDLNRNKVIPIKAPSDNCTGYCSSDGNYTLIYESYRYPVIVNNETGEFYKCESNYIPASMVYMEKELRAVSEGKFLAVDKDYNYYVLDVDGNIIVDLNNYEQSVVKMYPFVDGAAVIVFENNYVTFIDDTGEFLFEPVKGNVISFYNDLGVAIIINGDDGYAYSLDKYGNEELLETSYLNNIYYIKCKDKIYWYS